MLGRPKKRLNVFLNVFLLSIGGDLIDAWSVGGQHAVEDLIRDQFGVFMYKSGKGQIINRAEYLRWKFMENAEVSIPIEASLSSHDPLGKWVDHEASWQMQYRGALGESLLHVLIICDTKVHTKWARQEINFILNFFPFSSRFVFFVLDNILFSSHAFLSDIVQF